MAPDPAAIQPGARVALRFTGMAFDGAAVAPLGPAMIGVPYAIAGEEALVEVVSRTPTLRGRLVAIRRSSPDKTVPPCPHFGRCGGCQWQHISLPGQRRLKRSMVVAALQAAGVREEQVLECAGGDGWTYRNVLAATVGRRGPAVVAGFHGWGDRRLVNVEVCAVQHPTNVRILQVLRDALRSLGLPAYDPQSRMGLVRGIVGLTGYVTGEAIAVLSTTGPLPDRMAFVRAVLDRVPGLVGLMLTVRQGVGGPILGPRLTLLWGRRYIEDEILGLRVRLDPQAAALPNPRGLSLLLEAVTQAAHLRPDEQVLEAFAESGILTLALARAGRRAVGVVWDRETMAEAWAAAARNGIANAVFYTRDPGKVLAKLHGRGERTDVVIAAPPGEGLPDPFLQTLDGVGPRRLVYVGRSLPVTARDLGRLREVGYAVEQVRPVDLFPQTSHVHSVVSLHHR